MIVVSILFLSLQDRNVDNPASRRFVICLLVFVAMICLQV